MRGLPLGTVMSGLDPGIHPFLISGLMDGRVKPGQDERKCVRASRLRQTPMFLIGQYDSPFVRRVAIALRLYGIPFEHRPWSTFGDAETIAPYNPLRRVPTLVLDDGEALIESACACRASATTREAAQILVLQRCGSADQEPTVPADRRSRLR